MRGRAGLSSGINVHAHSAATINVRVPFASEAIFSLNTSSVNHVGLCNTPR